MVKLEYTLGPLTVNFRVLLEPKGFLRIIILFIALLAFSLTAGFNSNSNSNTVMCTGNVFNNITNYTASVNFNYPYDQNSYAVNVLSPAVFNRSIPQCAVSVTYQSLSSSAGFFVAMGVLTMIYVVGAIIIYMLFITPDLFMAKWLIIGDLFGTIIFGILYTIASLAWSVGISDLNRYVTGLLGRFAMQCFQCTDQLGPLNVRTTNFTQPAISAIFGWLASFIWFASIWFVYKDTHWHKDETGPLAKVYEHQRAKNTGEQYRGGEGEGKGEGGDTEAGQ